MPEPIAAPDLNLLAQTVPACLRQHPQWVCWRYVERDGRQTKCPISPTRGGPASSTDPATWGTFEQATSACRRCHDLEGVGFVFTPDDPFAGIDLDHCLDPATGEVKPWAEPILALLDSYSEISPSGAGVKVFVRACKASLRCKTGYGDGAVEMYDRGRFFTMTGRRLPQTPTDVEERQHQYDAVYELVFNGGHGCNTPLPPSAQPSSNGRAHLDDDQIIRLATRSRRAGPKFAALWAGRWNEHFNSRSEADCSVVFTESFYGREDKVLTARLLTELPGILNWAIEGWRQLRQCGHFVQPASVEDALRDMEDLSSPVGAFVRQRCTVDSGLRIWIDDLYGAWKEWCEADGRVSVITKQTFGRDLMAAAPGVVSRQAPTACVSTRASR